MRFVMHKKVESRREKYPVPAWEDLPFSWRAAINKKKEEGCENQREICSHQMEIGELGGKEGEWGRIFPIEKSNRENPIEKFN